MNKSEKKIVTMGSIRYILFLVVVTCIVSQYVYLFACDELINSFICGGVGVGVCCIYFILTWFQYKIQIVEEREHNEQGKN